MDTEKNPTPPTDTAPEAEGADGSPSAPDTPASQAAQPHNADSVNVEAKRPAAAPKAPARTPVTPSAREASSGTVAEAAPPGDTPGKETPAKTPAAARAVPGTGASRGGSTPTPSVDRGVSKGVAAKVPAATAGAGKVVTAPVDDGDAAINRMRRRIVWASVAGFLVTSFLMFLRFFMTRSLTEPSNVLRLGFPGDYNFGVDTKWQQQYRIWVVKNAERIFVINAVCTHLGCTPDWKESENKFKCPCHGSGYDSEGVNFEGPAPRPMDRAHVELDAEGQIVADKGRLYKWPKGEKNQFNDEGAYIRVG